MVSPCTAPASACIAPALRPPPPTALERRCGWQSRSRGARAAPGAVSPVTQRGGKPSRNGENHGKTQQKWGKPWENQQKWGKPWENPAEMRKTMGKPAEMGKTMGKASRKWGISCWNGDKIGEYGSISVKISFSVRLKTDYTPQWWNTYDYCNQHCCCSFSDKPIVTTEHVWFSRQTWWISKDLNSKTVILNNNSWISHGIA